MKISTDLALLSSSLEIITRLAPPSSGNITFSSNGKRLQIISAADVSRCTTVLPCTLEGEGEFAVPLVALKDAVKGRGNLDIVYKNTVVKVTSGRYAAELAAVDVIPLDPHDPEEGQTWKLSPEQSIWLRKALKDVALKPTALLSSWMPAGIKLTSKGGFVTCFDTQHLSWATSKEVSGDFECVLPIETITNVVDLFHKGAFTITHTASRIEVKNKLTQVFLNIPSLDDLPSLADVQAKIKSASSVDGKGFVLNKDAFIAFLENARAVMTKERAEVIVDGKGKGVSVEIRTSQGKVNALLAGKGTGSFKVDYEYLLEVLSKSGEELSLNCVEGSFIGMKLPSMNVIVALNQ